MEKLLQDKVCIVTGSGRGLGRAAALKFAGEGGKIVVTDLDEAPAMEVVREIEAMGTQAIAVVGDVTAKDFPDKLVDATVAAFGPNIDVLVNNAGFSWNGLVHKMTDKQWESIIDVHLNAPFRIVRAAAPYMRGNASKEIKEFGKAKVRKIINVSSLGGLDGSNSGMCNYSAAKAGIVGFSKSLALEWAHYNICVNCIAPGMTDTRIIASTDDEHVEIKVGGEKVLIGASNDIRKAFLDDIPLHRFGEPDEFADLALFLASPMSDYITSEVIRFTGGAMLGFVKFR